jgi:drug/metabolite transporter (DMT)-like permease
MNTLYWLWIPATILAAGAQTARNAMQRHLTETLGTVGATHVRFLYGFPFALVFLALACAASGRLPPVPDAMALGWIAGGAVTQVLATAAMLAAMRTQSFALAVAYTKTEPLQVAIFATIVLAEPVSPAGAFAIALACTGVVAMSGNPWRAGGHDLRATALGIASGGFFALSAVFYRGGILKLGEPVFWMASLTALAVALGLQAVFLSSYLALTDRQALVRVLGAWRPSLFAGAMGALASAGWFTGFSIATAAAVRTLGLVEVLFSFAVGRRLFKQAAKTNELVGVALVVAGVAILLVSA